MTPCPTDRASLRAMSASLSIPQRTTDSENSLVRSHHTEGDCSPNLRKTVSLTTKKPAYFLLVCTARPGPNMQFRQLSCLRIKTILSARTLRDNTLSKLTLGWLLSREHLTTTPTRDKWCRLYHLSLTARNSTTLENRIVAMPGERARDRD